MKYSFKKLICTLLCTSLLALTACSCNSQGNSEATAEPTTIQPTTAVATTSPLKTATDDSETQPATYNFSRLKENSDYMLRKFDSAIANNKYKGVVYNKIGNDFEYISQKGQAVIEEHKSNSVNTQYYVGSLTKQFTAVAVMKLVEEEKLSLDDTIDKYFDDYKYGEEITIKNLLTMTSGIPSYTCQNGSIDADYYTDSQIKYSLKEDDGENNKKVILDWILSQKLSFEPDSRFEFSDSNYYLLGQIIEKVSDTSYEEYIKENIFEPIGMKSSVFDNADNLALGYDGLDNCEWLYYDGVGYSSTGLISTASDILKWIYAFDEYKIISEESVEEMCTPYLESYGYGFFIYQDRIVQTAGFDKYSAMLEFTRSESEIFIALSNYNYSDPVHLFAMFRVYLKPYYS